MLYELLRHVRPLVLNSARVVEASLRGDGLSVGMRAVLEMLAERGPMTVPDIADRLDLARQGIQRHVNDLTVLGLVESRPNPAHRRSVLIVTTGTGDAVFTRIRSGELARLGAMASEHSDEEIATAVRVLAALNRDVRHHAAALREAGEPRGATEPHTATDARPTAGREATEPRGTAARGTADPRGTARHGTADPRGTADTRGTAARGTAASRGAAG
ncbi:hypothetical protein GCM10025331_59050 [Actinoplanes utahensis]|nr:hypothetical protein Aut01nite_70240 [Actinoplanes utahensis]